MTGVSLTGQRLAAAALALRARYLDDQLQAIELRLKRITEHVAPALTELKGVGPDVASALLLAAGDNPERLANEQSFASLCGTGPVQASSGKTRRHRLNRGGDRQANHCSVAHHARTAQLRPALEGLPHQARQRRQKQDRSHPLPQALHRPRGLRRPTQPDHPLTAGAPDPPPLLG